MKQSDLPIKINIPWASGETVSYVREVPDASQQQITNGAASWTDGFPPNCFISKASGGIPPFGQDFNGGLRRLSAWTRYIMAAGVVPYDATWQNANGGYPLNAVVSTGYTGAAGTTGTLGRMWVSVVDGNTTNPDTGGAGWLYLPLPADVLALIGSQTRINAPGPITLYVRLNGSDSNNGLTNTDAGAFATPQAAYNFLTKSYNPGFTATIQLGQPGTYAGIVALNNGVTGQISILGDQTAGQANQGNYIVTPVPFSTGYSCVLSAVQTITVDGVTLDASSLNNGQSVQIARAGGQGALVLGRHTVRYSGSNTNVAAYSADPGASLNFSQNFTVAVGTVGAIIGSLGSVGVLSTSGVTMNIANATFTNFINALGGSVNLQSMVFSGSGNTGSRYNVSNEATILPPGGNNYAAIPGTTAGTVPLGAGYVAGDPGPVWSVYSAPVTSTGGAFGSAAGTIRYQRWGKIVSFQCQINIGTLGSASGSIITQLPITPQGNVSFIGVEIAVNGKSVNARPNNASGQLQINNYDNSSPIVSGSTFIVTGVYEAQN